MRKWMRTIGAACAVALLAGTALAEDMPVVTDTPLAGDMPIIMDEPLTEEEIAEAEKDRVREVQQMLIDLGMLDGAADGRFGQRTAAALRRFQSKNSLVASGEINEPTLQALREQAESAGSVREAQQRLIDLGYLRGEPDGVFGGHAGDAIELFQAMAGLEVTGELNETTREALFSDDARAVPAKLAKGDKGDAVLALQERLKQLGFHNGKIDGSYGKTTAASVRRFQEHLIAQGVDENLGIEVNGVATPATQAILFDEAYSSYLCDIVLGDTGDEVLRIERRLNQLGYMDATAHETFDDYAAASTAAFRADAGLGEENRVDQATVDALFAEDAPSAEHFVPHEIHSGDSGLAVEAVEEALLSSGMIIRMPGGRYDDTLVAAVDRLKDFLDEMGDTEHAALFEDAQTLSVDAQTFIAETWQKTPVQGNGKAAIARIQRRLHTLFYLDKYSIDGAYGGKTRAAIQAFQGENGLNVTGTADDATRAALFSKSAAAKPLPYRVEVSIDDQRVYIYERNEAGEYDLTHTFICSTGRGESTPRGIFLDGYPVNAWHYFTKFDCWAKYSFVIEGGIMFHSVIYSSNNDSTLRQSSVYALGSKASHGCIRLQVSDAKWLFTHCKRGTLAIVIY